VKISRLETQKKNPRRVSVHIDGAYRFGLAKSLALKYDLYEGREITEDEIKDFLLAAEKDKVRERAFRLLNFRDRSVEEMRERLLKLGFDPPLVDQTITELVEDKSLDDRRFSRAFADDCTNLKLKGNQFLRRELKRKKVAPEIIEEVAAGRDERALLERLFQTKLSRLDRRNPKDRQKIIRYLAYRGFALNQIFELLGNRDE